MTWIHKVRAHALSWNWRETRVRGAANGRTVPRGRHTKPVGEWSNPHSGAGYLLLADSDPMWGPTFTILAKRRPEDDPFEIIEIHVERWDELVINCGGFGYEDEPLSIAVVRHNKVEIDILK